MTQHTVIKELSTDGRSYTSVKETQQWGQGFFLLNIALDVDEVVIHSPIEPYSFKYNRYVNVFDISPTVHQSNEC